MSLKEQLMKLKNQSTKSNEQTAICKICFNEIKINSLYQIFGKSPTICNKCLSKFEPKFIRFKCNKYNAIAIYNYDEQIRSLLYQYKGCYDIELKDVFFGRYLNELKLLYKGYVVVPAPSYYIEDLKREFNHIIELASLLNLPIIKCIQKIENIKQSSLSPNKRHDVIKNLKMADLESVRNKKVLIMDDVFTTGSTVSAIIKLIETCHPKTIKILVLAKTIISKHTNR